MACGTPPFDVRSSTPGLENPDPPSLPPFPPCSPRVTALSLSQPDGPFYRVPVSQVVYLCTVAVLKYVTPDLLSLLFPSGIPATNGSLLIRTFDDLYQVRSPGVKTLSDFLSRFDPYGRFAEVRRGAYINTDHASELDRDRSSVYFAFPEGTKESIISARRNLLKLD